MLVSYLRLYILATSKVISGWVLTYRQCTLMVTLYYNYSDTQLEDQAVSTII